VIPIAELRALRAEWSLRDDVIEKDYTLGWLLAAIASDQDLATTWVFKGGTSLRKCYYETYRFSEDLDFTIVEGGPEEPEALFPIFERVGQWLADQAGIELVLDDRSFVRRVNRRGNPTTQARIAFRGPSQRPQLPKVKLDLTSDEVLVQAPVVRPILHPYSDGPSRPKGCSHTRSQNCSPRSFAHSPSGVGPATSTTSSTSTDIPTSSAGPQPFSPHSIRSVHMRASQFRTPTRYEHRRSGKSSSRNGTTCWPTNFRICRHSRSFGRHSMMSSHGCRASSVLQPSPAPSAGTSIPCGHRQERWPLGGEAPRSNSFGSPARTGSR
jgi:hypothetical protein